MNFDLAIDLGVRSARGRPNDAAAAAFFARMASEPPSRVKHEYNRLFQALKSNDFFSGMDALYIMPAHSEQVRLLNLVGDVYNLTKGGTHPDFVPFSAFVPDGASIWLDTNFNPTTAAAPKFTLDSAHQFAWHKTAVDGSFDVGNTTSRITKPGTASVFTRPNNTTNYTAAGTYTTHKGWNRTAANATQMYIAGAAVGPGTTQASTALTNFNFCIGRTSATEYGASQPYAVHFGAAGSAQQIGGAKDALQRFLGALGLI
jgi:hypothetical protein